MPPGWLPRVIISAARRVDNLGLLSGEFPHHASRRAEADCRQSGRTSVRRSGHRRVAPWGDRALGIRTRCPLC
eukprot:15402098-Alexandrium_andersonii.AAC.1